MTTTQQALDRTHDLMLMIRAATVQEMRAAAYAIARYVKDTYPDATRVHLQGSDQGDWLDVTGWDTGDDSDHHDLELCEQGTLGCEVSLAATHLYSTHIGSDTRIGAVPGLLATGRRDWTYLLDIDQVLTDCADMPPVSEVLTIRDPDGPTAVHATIFGELLTEELLSIHSIDAGSGWNHHDWVTHRADCLHAATPALHDLIRATFDNPPGRHYITTP